MTDVLVGRGEDTHREDSHVKMETEIGFMLSQAKHWASLGLPEASTEPRDLLSQLLEGTSFADTWILDF